MTSYAAKYPAEATPFQQLLIYNPMNTAVAGPRLVHSPNRPQTTTARLKNRNNQDDYT